MSDELEWYKKQVQVLEQNLESYKDALSRSRMVNARLKRAIFEIAESKEVGMNHDDCVQIAIVTIQFNEI